VTGVAVLVRVGSVPRLLLPSLRSVEQQSARPTGVVLLVDSTTPTGAHDWIEAIAAARGFMLVRSQSSSPGAALNEAWRSTSSEFVLVLEAGDELEPHAVALIGHRMGDAADAGFSLVGMRLLGSGPDNSLVLPDDASAFAVAAWPQMAHASTPFRRSSLETVGGFDESLPGLEFADAVIRILQTGGSGLSLSEPIVRRRTELPGRWRHASQAEGLEIFEAFVRRHLDLLASDPVTVLRAREDAVRTLGARYRTVRDTRQARLAEIAELREAKARTAAPSDAASPFDMGGFHRTSPWSRNWGYERGVPVDRYYVERFLQAHAGDVHGRVLEVQEADYTTRFGGSRVAQSDVLDLEVSNTRANVVADLRDAPNIPDATYDCIIITQTLHVIDDMDSVVRECVRILKPGGVLLATLPAASRVCLEYGRDGDFWRVTAAGARRLFEQAFDPEQVEVRAHGNVLVTAAFQYGLGLAELSPADLEVDDAFNPTLVTVRARKAPARTSSVGLTSREAAERRGVVLLYHRVADARPDVHGLCVSPLAFNEQMDYVAAHCTPIGLEELVEATRTGDVPPRAVAVTFDDGYLDTLLTATPVLYSRGIPATVFATTAALDEAGVFRYWWDILEWAILVDPPACLTVPLPGGERSFSLTTPAERMAAHQTLHGLLVPLEASARDGVMRHVIDGRVADADRVTRRMSVAELRAIGDVPGMSVGAHGHDHLALPAHSAEVQRLEISRSRLALESALSVPVRAFAYPFGAWSAETAALVAESGLRLAVTCEDGAVRPGADPLSLARVTVRAETTQAFAARLMQAFTNVAAQ
jgi:peptidoglycan/xylan/chitin deacetylase (PgdA/CDA1 family)/SAM-dependent methyltransferase